MSYFIRTHIDIEAPALRIWDILIDLERYHEWNPFIVDARGRIAPDAHFEVRPRATGGRQVTFVPQVTDYQEGREFTWTGAFYRRWFALGDHTFRLTPYAHDHVRLDHDERIYGVGSLLVWLIAKRQIRIGFESMNQALKLRAEEGSK